MTLAERLAKRDATVAVIGLGRVGLPLAIAFAKAGLRVMGVDIDPNSRRFVELGKMPFQEPGSDQPLAEVIDSGMLSVHRDPNHVVPIADVVLLSVGTPLAPDLRPDYGQLRDALQSLVPFLRPGQLLVQRSTVSPGTLEKVVAPFLRERIPEVANSLLLAACPERIAEGSAMEEIATLPEIIGAMDEESATTASELFLVLGPEKRVHVTDPTSAEMAKLFTNVYRYVNFALANEFAILGEHYQVDAHRIIEIANDDYPRANIPKPGPAGGPCLSKDGYFLVEELTMPDFVLMAWKLNDSTPAHIVRRLTSLLARHEMKLVGTSVAVLGQTFKRNSDDLRQSPAVRIKDLLVREGADVRTHDPHLAGPTLGETLDGAGAFILATNHSYYETLDPVEMAALMLPPRIGLDCWGVLERGLFDSNGIKVVAFGAGEGG